MSILGQENTIDEVLVDASIHEQDLVVVRKQPVAESGDIVEALLVDVEMLDKAIRN